MYNRNLWINRPVYRVLQHIVFWTVSFFIFLNVFRIGPTIKEIDYVYTGLFHAFLVVAVYIHLYILLPSLRNKGSRLIYFAGSILLLGLFTWLNYSFFSTWSAVVMPGYYFISYFTTWEVISFFLIYLGLTTLLKLSKAWFSINAVQRELLETERLKSIREKELLEMEARALRAQMNPHFIFNSLNSIKSLIQEGKGDMAVTYLSTFSKLIRTLFNNADRKDISLFDEVETCKLYLQLESMRFDSRFAYQVNVQPGIDLKSIWVPALIIQPFIENAIWHGIVPKQEGGHVSLSVNQSGKLVEVTIEDNGIGRPASQLSNSSSSLGHQSKGINLTRTRLELDNLLQERSGELEIQDNIHGQGGTRVIIKLKQD